MGTTDVLTIVNSLSISDRLLLVEEILRTIREEKIDVEPTGENLLEFAGIISEEEADIMKSAVVDARKIDADEW